MGSGYSVYLRVLDEWLHWLPSGFRTGVTHGPDVSTVTETAPEAPPVLPAPSVAPAPPAPAPSNGSTELAASAVPATTTVELVRTAPSAGLVITGVSGASVSTVHVREAGLGSGVPAVSFALTWKVCAPWARAL